MTMTRDEAEMLPRWLSYYGEQFGYDNLIVIDDGTTDGSTDSLPCPVLRVPPEPWKQNWMQTRTDLVNGISRGLLACYDAVIFSDVDEFLLPDPRRHANLAEFVQSKADQDVVAGAAVNVLHNADVEPAFDPSRGVLAQRRFVKFVPAMCKPLIKRIGVPWMMGFHGIKAAYGIDPELLMVHLKYFDTEALVAVADARKELHDNHGRGAAASSWSLGAKEIQRQLHDWVHTSDGGEPTEFDAGQVDAGEVVRSLPNGFFRSTGRQLVAMENNPLQVLPERFRDLL